MFCISYFVLFVITICTDCYYSLLGKFIICGVVVSKCAVQQFLHLELILFKALMTLYTVHYSPLFASCLHISHPAGRGVSTSILCTPPYPPLPPFDSRSASTSTTVVSCSFLLLALHLQPWTLLNHISAEKTVNILCSILISSIFPLPLSLPSSSGQL